MSTIGKFWHTEDGSKQITQYGVRLPDGTIHWGDVTQHGQPVTIPHGGLSFTVTTDPNPQTDTQRTLAGVRGRIADSMAAAFVPHDEAVAHAMKAVRVSRPVFIGFGEIAEVTEG